MGYGARCKFLVSIQTVKKILKRLILITLIWSDQDRKQQRATTWLSNQRIVMVQNGVYQPSHSSDSGIRRWTVPEDCWAAWRCRPWRASDCRRRRAQTTTSVQVEQPVRTTPSTTICQSITATMKQHNLTCFSVKCKQGRISDHTNSLTFVNALMNWGGYAKLKS